MNVVNQGKKEGVLGKKIYPLIHLLMSGASAISCDQTWSGCLVKGGRFAPYMNTAFTYGNYKSMAYSTEKEH